MTNTTNFIGWSGKTEFTKLDLSKLTYSGSSQTSPKVSSTNKTPISFNKNRPKQSKVTKGVKQTPVAPPKTQANPTFTKGKKLGVAPKFSVKYKSIFDGLPFTAGTVDTSFPYGDSTGFDGDVLVSKIQSDGKILVGGNFEYYDYDGDSYYSPYLIRLNSDGSPDFSFQYTHLGYDEGFYLNGAVNTIDIQSDGKILIGGKFTYWYEYVNRYSPRIMRFNSDGSFDDTFFVGDGFNDEVKKIIVQPDGKILVCGAFYYYNNSEYDPNNGPAYWRIIRLQNNGAPDSSFNTGYGVDFDDYGVVNDMVLQPDGKIIIGGDFYNYNNNINSDYIARINSDGTYDYTFVVGNGFNDTVNTLALQSTGKVIVGGYFNYYNNVDLNNGYIVRLNTDGAIDTRFGEGLSDVVFSLAIQSDDKILVGGSFGTFYPNNFDSLSIDELVRFHSNCTFDYSFYHDELFNSSVYSITIDSNNYLYVGGQFDNDGDPITFPLNRFGRLHNFISEYPYLYVAQSCTQPYYDKTITYVVGSMTPRNFYSSTYSLQKLDSPSVTVCGYIINDYPSNMVDCIIVNEYNDCDSAYYDNIKLVTVADSISEDTSQLYVDKKYQIGDILFADFIVNQPMFTTPFYAKFAATIVEELPLDYFPPFYYVIPTVNYQPYKTSDEAINYNGVHYVLLGCNEEETTFPLIHKHYYASLSLLSPTGINPVKFLIDYVPYGDYSWISDGTPEIYSTIEFGTYDNNYDTLCDLGSTVMSPSGTANFNFNNNSQFNDMVYTTLEQPDGKILVGGNFTDLDGTNVGRFTRINTDGTIDTEFNSGGDGFDNIVKAIALQPDGKILVGGNFDYYNNELAGKIIRLNSDGSIDQTFTYSSEFNGIVRAIALQKDGKIVVGGGFSYYYDYYCPQIVRLNSDGTPDPTFVMGDGFDGDNVFAITIESTLDTPFYNTDGPATYTENILVGGWFTWYNGTTVRGIVKLSSTGEVINSFGEGFNISYGPNPRVNQILLQPDGKLLILGGNNNGNSLYDYNGQYIAQNIVRLVNVNGQYVIDQTFAPRNFDDGGGFDGATLSITLLPNGKYIVGGQFYEYNDVNGNHNDLGYLVRLNSNGSLDETFTFQITDNYVNKVLLLSSGKLLVGGWFSEWDGQYLIEVYQGEEYKLYSFNECDGEMSNVYLPTNFYSQNMSTSKITYFEHTSEGLDEMTPPGNPDDDYIKVDFPSSFSANFNGVNYTSFNLSTNAYITFGDANNFGDPSSCCFDIPNEIPMDVQMPGVYISTSAGLTNPTVGMDDWQYRWFSGLTDSNTFVVRFEGVNYDYEDGYGDPGYVNYSFVFYKNNPNYFDLYIDNVTYFYNNDPTGGLSDGVNPNWLATFDSSPMNAYRIGLIVDELPIKGNVNDIPSVCGIAERSVFEPQLSGVALGGSMYFDGTNNTTVTVDYNTAMDLNEGPWTIEWFQNYTSESTCCLRVFDIGSFNTEHIGASLENGQIAIWVEGNSYFFTLNSEINNTWNHFAITAENVGGPNWKLRVFQNGQQLDADVNLALDINNFDGPTQLPLTIGGMGNGTSCFEGYITNFRWTNGNCRYTSNFDVPTSPLNVDGSQLLLLATNSSDLIYDSSESQVVSQSNVIWSNKSPFSNPNAFSLYTVANNTKYNNCTDCGQTYKTMLYVRDGVNPDTVEMNEMKLSDIENVKQFGPIFTIKGIPCYEILNYFK